MSWEVISTYSRQQALDETMLIDVEEMAAEAGFRHPLAVTAAVWNRCVHIPQEHEARCDQDEPGRLWDVVWMASLAARGVRDGKSDRVTFEVLVRDPATGELEKVGLWLHCGPGDEGEPVLTVMIQGED